MYLVKSWTGEMRDIALFASGLMREHGQRMPRLLAVSGELLRCAVLFLGKIREG